MQFSRNARVEGFRGREAERIANREMHIVKEKRSNKVGTTSIAENEAHSEV